MSYSTLEQTISMYACCIPVSGFRRSIIIDFQRCNLYLVPNDLVYILSKNKGKNISFILSKLNTEDKKTFEEYLDFLLKNEIAFCLDKQELNFFEPISLTWNYPSQISNATIELNKESLDRFCLSVNNLDKMGCDVLNIYFYYDIDVNDLIPYLEHIKLTSIQSVNLAINFNDSFTKENLLNMVRQYYQISTIDFYNLKSLLSYNNSFAQINYFSNCLENLNNCGVINSNCFANNLTLFTESQHYNSCLNRKISIDVDGNIKNCPAMGKSFGNIKDVTIEEAINKPGFKNLWGIRKDDVDVCKDCEFRYICTDCRCFIKNPDDIYSQPAKCGYNPYIAKWNNEEGYITVEEWRKQNSNWEKKAKRKPLVKVPQKVE